MHRIVVVVVLFAVPFAGAAPARAGACDNSRHVRAASHPDRAGRAPLHIGDSTSIVAAAPLGRLGIEADARGCRQFGEGVRIIASRRRAGALPGVVVLALGANGPLPDGAIANVLRAMGRYRILGLVTPKNSSGSAAAMRRAARKSPSRVVLIDWARYSTGRSGWFGGDNLHVGQIGADAFARFIRRRIAPYAFPPVRRLKLPRRARGSKRCGIVRAQRPPISGVGRAGSPPRDVRPRPVAGPPPTASRGAELEQLRLAPHAARSLAMGRRAGADRRVVIGLTARR